MEIAIEWPAIGLATLSSMVLGFIWYHEKVFGAAWMKVAKLKQADIEKGMMKAMVLSIVRSFLVAFALYHIIYVTAVFYSETSWMMNSLQVGAWVGLAFPFMSLIMHDAFDNRPTMLTKIHSMFDLISILAAAAIIGMFSPF